MQHFRAAFAPIASHVLVCDSGSLATPDLRKLQFKRVPRPIYPLDPDVAFRLESSF
jgi:microcystin degradation protein MlrC